MPWAVASYLPGDKPLSLKPLSCAYPFSGGRDCPREGIFARFCISCYLTWILSWPFSCLHGDLLPGMHQRRGASCSGNDASHPRFGQAVESDTDRYHGFNTRRGPRISPTQIL
ncbi:hypothetical protein GOP47_0009658 [Adiantum capillus-veneris]|uniref:Uncharacterized protein n=1 Tax=Adiantum capillus-veneris TaxID=13818 RepID=A0A9D4UY74_ADICA|nr:hypothetical protein GOP47_0009658 [Adiantum capillus-veneris]